MNEKIKFARKLKGKEKCHEWMKNDSKIRMRTKSEGEQKLEAQKLKEQNLKGANFNGNKVFRNIPK